MKDSTFIKLQKLIPQRWLTRFIGRFANSQWTPLKQFIIGWFINRYNVNMEEAIDSNPNAYPTFNAFFTRRLKPELRPFPSESNALASPCDGQVSQSGPIVKSLLIQAKNHYYTVEQLVGDFESSKPYLEAQFATLYLSPKDYHRVHMPVDGKLVKMRYIAGRLFSVNQVTQEHIPDLFADNERLVMIFETALGPMILVLVGAMIVGSIHTPFAGQMAPQDTAVQEWHYAHNPIKLKCGDEIGHFELGSTVIMLMPRANVKLTSMQPGAPLKVGQTIGTFKDYQS